MGTDAAWPLHVQFEAWGVPKLQLVNLRAAGVLQLAKCGTIAA